MTSEKEAKIMDMASAGKSDVLIARDLGLTLAEVMRVRSGAPSDSTRAVHKSTQSVSTPTGSVTVKTTAVAKPIQQQGPTLNPKLMIERMALDLEECVVLALAEYKADPSSEAGYTALTSLATTFKEFIKSRESLNDPQEIAESVVLQILRPLIYAMLRSTISAFDGVNKELSLTFNSDTQREKFKETLGDMLKALTSQIKTDYNRGVHTLEEVYGVELHHLFLKKADTIND
jgi:hypothetical protein